MGIAYIIFLARLDQNSAFCSNRKRPYTYDPGNGVLQITCLFYIGPSSNSRLTRTDIKSRPNLCQIGIVSMFHLKVAKIVHKFIMGKMVQVYGIYRYIFAAQVSEL